MRDKVMVAMSGGVDSAAAAVLLIETGYNVSGGTLWLFDGDGPEQAIRDARNIAESLKIKHFTYDMKDGFKREVMDYFARAYINGDTPNPCARCNFRAKFPMFLEAAGEEGYSRMATGHYAKVEKDSGSGRWLLKCGDDRLKDQSYFLYALSQDILSRTLFPLGGLSKKEAKELVRSRGLKAASRPESQDVCFLPDGDYKAFIERNYGYISTDGNFVDPGGNVLGRHNGAIGFTRGQRRGLGVSASTRLYVLDKNMQSNTVVLGQEKELFSCRIFVKDINLIAVGHIDGTIRVDAKIRYSKNATSAHLTMTDENSAVLEFSTAQRAPASGQAAVFYDGDTVLGGGIITERPADCRGRYGY